MTGQSPTRAIGHLTTTKVPQLSTRNLITTRTATDPLLRGVAPCLGDMGTEKEDVDVEAEEVEAGGRVTCIIGTKGDTKKTPDLILLFLLLHLRRLRDRYQ